MILLYSTQCPNCRMLEALLSHKGISFEVCSDVEIMLKRGIQSVPQLEVNGKLMTYQEAKEWAMAQ